MADNAGSLATRAVDATNGAVSKAKDRVADFAEEHPVKIEEVIESAAKVPGVHIDREQYLIGALSIHSTEQMAREAFEKTPALAGAPKSSSKSSLARP